MEVDRGSASSIGRHMEDAFIVRLRSGDASVIVTVGLSRVAAERLADHIAEVVTGSSSTAFAS